MAPNQLPKVLQFIFTLLAVENLFFVARLHYLTEKGSALINGRSPENYFPSQSLLNLIGLLF